MDMAMASRIWSINESSTLMDSSVARQLIFMYVDNLESIPPTTSWRGIFLCDRSHMQMSSLCSSPESPRAQPLFDGKMRTSAYKHFNRWKTDSRLKYHSLQVKRLVIEKNYDIRGANAIINLTMGSIVNFTCDVNMVYICKWVTWVIYICK